MRNLVFALVISSATVSGIAALRQAGAAWIPDHSLLRDAQWHRRMGSASVQIDNKTTRASIEIVGGTRAQDQLRYIGAVQNMDAPKFQPGSPYNLSFGTDSRCRDTGMTNTTYIKVLDQKLLISVLYGRRETTKAEALAIAEKLVRAFAARAMALNAKTVTTESVNGFNVPGYRITGTGKHVARVMEMSSRLGWGYEFFPDDGYVMLRKNSNQVKVFLGSRTVKKNGVEIHLDTPTMEEGGRVFADRGLIQVLTGS